MKYKYGILNVSTCEGNEKLISDLFASVPFKRGMWLSERGNSYLDQPLIKKSIFDFTDNHIKKIEDTKISLNVALEVEFNAPEDYEIGDKFYINEFDKHFVLKPSYWLYLGNGKAVYSRLFCQYSSKYANVVFETIKGMVINEI